jgi:hypothetical protein
VPAAQFKQAPPFASAGSWAGTLSAFDSPDMPALDRDMLNELHKKWMQWRILVQMRAAVTYLLQEDQLARWVAVHQQVQQLSGRRVSCCCCCMEGGALQAAPGCGCACTS